MDDKKAIEEIKRWTPTLLSLGENCTNHTMEAQQKAIASLEAWDKIVELINTKYGYILKATKYGNKDAEQQTFSYSNVLMYEVADIIEDILYDIEEYRKEIEE